MVTEMGGVVNRKDILDLTDVNETSIKRRLDELKPYELESMFKSWNIAKTFASDVEKEEPYIYWADVKNVIKKVRQDYDGICDEDLLIILQCLEQKVQIP